LRWGGTEVYVKSVLEIEQFRPIAPDASGNPTWIGELLGSRVKVRPILYQDRLDAVIVDVFPSGTLSMEATADSVRRALTRTYGKPRVEAPGVLNWASAHLCFELDPGYVLELFYRNPDSDTGGLCKSKRF